MQELKTYREVLKAISEGHEVEGLVHGVWLAMKNLVVDLAILDTVFLGTFRIKSTKPSINWEHVSPNFKYLARNMYGSTALYEREPILKYDDWGSRGGSRIGAITFSSLSKGNCDWEESLVKRPEGI